MTAKFIPFDPKTAKNGDIVYYYPNTKFSYIYVGKCPTLPNASVCWNPREEGYCFQYDKSMVIQQPMKTVWINLYHKMISTNNVGYFYPTEKEAKEACSQNYEYIGTFPIEIPA